MSHRLVSERAAQVIAPAADGPAEKGGIKPLDRLLAIGEKSTRGMSLYEASDLLQGVEGSEVRAPAS